MIRRIEYDTGLPRDFKLNGPIRVWENLFTLCVRLRDEHKRRGRDLPLMTSYELTGVYSHKIVPTKRARGPAVVIVHNLTGTEITLPAGAKMPGSGTEPDPSWCRVSEFANLAKTVSYKERPLSQTCGYANATFKVRQSEQRLRHPLMR